MLFGDAMADTRPLAEVIAHYADQKMFDAIAGEYPKGRLLLIGTTDLDAQRPVIWNIGAIAASGHPSARPVPQDPARVGVHSRRFPAGAARRRDRRRKFQEMHVDGGAIAQLFLYPGSIDLGRLPSDEQRVAYVIRNARLDPEHAEIERRTLTIAGRAISTMLAASGHNDVLRAYFLSQRDGVDYNLAYIGADFKRRRPPCSTRPTCGRCSTMATRRRGMAAPGTRCRPASPDNPARTRARVLFACGRR